MLVHKIILQNPNNAKGNCLYQIVLDSPWYINNVNNIHLFEKSSSKCTSNLKITFNSIIFYCTMIFRMLLLDSSHFLYSSRRNPSVSQSTYLTTTLDFSVFLPLQYVCYLSSFNHQNNKVMFFELEIIWNANPSNTFKNLFRFEKPCTYCSNPTAKKHIQRFSCLPNKPTAT